MSTPDLTAEPSGDPALREAYAWCERFLQEHAHRDPMAATLRVPALRQPVAVVYAFARTAEDLADLASDPVARVAALDRWQDTLERAYHGDAREPLFVALGDVARRHGLPITPLRDLLAGLRAESSSGAPITFAALVRRYENSTGPLARVLLHLGGADASGPFTLAERFAIGLRLLDDIVDLPADLRRGRHRIPQEDLLAFGLSPDDLLAEPRSPAVAELVACAATRARAYVQHGRPLLRQAPAVLRPLVAALLRYALRVADRLESGALDPFSATESG